MPTKIPKIFLQKKSIRLGYNFFLKDSAISNKEGFLELYQKFVNKTNERAVFQGLENHQTFHYDKLGEAKKIPELLKQTVVLPFEWGLRNHTRFIATKI